MLDMAGAGTVVDFTVATECAVVTAAGTGGEADCGARPATTRPPAFGADLAVLRTRLSAPVAESVAATISEADFTAVGAGPRDPSADSMVAAVVRTVVLADMPALAAGTVADIADGGIARREGQIFDPTRSPEIVGNIAGDFSAVEQPEAIGLE
jgi:hypothetical protein